MRRAQYATVDFTIMASIMSSMRSRPPILAAAILLTVLPAFTQKPNTLTPQEKAQGWRLLFDGKTTSGWRSTHGPDFPATGWEVKDGLLSVTEQGRSEGGRAERQSHGGAE